MNSIVIGVDGSEPALKAARWAAGVARATNARVILACVEAPVPVLPEWEQARSDSLGIVEEQAERALHDAAVALDYPVSERVVLDGKPAEALAKLAADRNASLVVVGSRGLGAMKRLLLGSVADRVVHVAECPVVVVPDTAQSSR